VELYLHSLIRLQDVVISKPSKNLNLLLLAKYSSKIKKWAYSKGFRGFMKEAGGVSSAS
jgi:hypothetical protein